MRVIDHTPELRRGMPQEMNRALEAVGITLEGYAKLLCPVDTGRLRNSITHATSINGGSDEYADNRGNTFAGGSARQTPNANTVCIGTNVEYAAYVEMGTVHQTPNGSYMIPPQPFLRPAVENHLDECKNIFEAYLNQN